LHLARREPALVQSVGRGLVRAMPVLLSVIATVGVAAMLWVGGHIILAGLDDLGWHWLYDHVHELQHHVEHGASFASGVLGWLTNTVASAALGILVGAVVVAVMHLVPQKSAHH
ncbi:MAG: DUF808 family protein, partial [Marmoricola sp.]